jgi:hypothetical protein
MLAIGAYLLVDYRVNAEATPDSFLERMARGGACVIRYWG